MQYPSAIDFILYEIDFIVHSWLIECQTLFKQKSNKDQGDDHETGNPYYQRLDRRRRHRRLAHRLLPGEAAGGA
jgi:hypothetical protein